MQNLEQRLDEVVDSALTDRRMVGAVVRVQQSGESLYSKSHGLLDREAGVPMRGDAIFRLSSVTKPIIATTILAMADARLLGLDDAVTDYLPDFRPALPDGTRPTITLHHLLTHTSGLGPLPPLTPQDVAAGKSQWRWSTAEVLDAIASVPLAFAPGAGWRYGTSIDVLGVIAGRLVDGRPEDAARRFVLDPLDMSDTRFSVTDSTRLAKPYADGPDGAEAMQLVHTIAAPWGGTVTYDIERILDPHAFQSGGGGMAGTAGDVMTLLAAIAAGGGPILHPDTAARALDNQTPQLRHPVGPGWQFSYLGAWLDDPVAADWLAARGTSRWGGIYGHCWLLDPVSGLTMVSLSNTGLEGSDGVYREALCRAVYGE